MTVTLQRGSDLTWAILLSVGHLVFQLIIQPGIMAGWGLGWDGMYYYMMAAGTDPPGHHYAERIAVPFLARHFPFSDLRLNFLIVNSLFGLVFSVLSYLVVARVIPRASLLTKITSWCLLCATHLSPIPEAVWYPTQIDSAANTFLMVVLYAVVAGAESPLVYGAIFFCGTLTRESFPAFAVLLLIAIHLEPLSGPYRAWLGRWIRGNQPLLRMLVGAVAGSVLAYALVVLVGPYNPLQFKSGLFLKWVGRIPLLAMFAAAISVYGASIFFYVLYRALTVEDHVRNPLREQRWSALVTMLVILVLSQGGTNTERYFFPGLPIVVLYVTPYIEALVVQGRYGAWVLGFAFMLVFQRALVPIDPSGIAGCDLWSYVAGGSTWIGHWVQVCSRADAARLSFAYLAVCAFVLLAARASNYRSLVQQSDRRGR